MLFGGFVITIGLTLIMVALPIVLIGAAIFVIGVLCKRPVQWVISYILGKIHGESKAAKSKKEYTTYAEVK